MKDKKIFIVIGVLVLILVAVGAYLMFGNKSQAPVDEDAMQEEVIPTIAPEDLGLEMELRSDNKAVKFTISKVSEIDEVEYEVVWDAVSPEDENIKLNRSSVGSATIEGDSYESEFIDLGTCSSGKCRFDTGVTKINLILKVTKKDGSIYQSEKTLSVE